METVEKTTGIHIDHYAEIGFGGFVGVVDAVGGVDICVKDDIKDPKAGLNLKAAARRWTAARRSATSAPGSTPAPTSNASSTSGSSSPR